MYKYENFRMVAVLKLLALTSSILYDWGYRIQNPVVIVSNTAASIVAEKLSVFEPVILSSADSQTELESAIANTISDFVFYCFGGRKSDESRLEFISSVMQTHRMSGAEVNCIPVILTENLISADLLPEAIILEMEFDKVPFGDIFDILPATSEIALAKEYARKKCKNLSGIKKLFFAAVSFAYPQLKKNSKLNLLQAIEDSATILAERSENAVDPGDATEAFLYAFEKTIKKLSNVHVIDADKPIDLENIKFESVILFSDEKVFLHNLLFRKIAAEVSTLYSPITLKRLLAEEGVLEKGSKRDYIKKLSLKSTDGIGRRFDLLHFKRDMLARPGELDIISEMEENKQW